MVSAQWPIPTGFVVQISGSKHPVPGAAGNPTLSPPSATWRGLGLFSADFRGWHPAAFSFCLLMRTRRPFRSGPAEYIKELESAGLIEITRRGQGKTNLYKLHFVVKQQRRAGGRKS